MTGSARRRATARDLFYFRTPGLWPLHPFLAVTRQAAGGAGRELGILYDARSTSGIHGYDCTVFLCNLFLLPRTEAELLGGPRLVYDTFEELADDGWVVD